MDDNMGANGDKVTEAQVRKAVRRALMKLSKSIDSEPRTLVIEADRTLPDISAEAEAEIRAFLFKRG